MASSAANPPLSRTITSIRRRSNSSAKVIPATPPPTTQTVPRITIPSSTSLASRNIASLTIRLIGTCEESGIKRWRGLRADLAWCRFELCLARCVASDTPARRRGVFVVPPPCAQLWRLQGAVEGDAGHAEGRARRPHLNPRGQFECGAQRSGSSAGGSPNKSQSFFGLDDLLGPPTFWRLSRRPPGSFRSIQHRRDRRAGPRQSPGTPRPAGVFRCMHGSPRTLTSASWSVIVFTPSGINHALETALNRLRVGSRNTRPDQGHSSP